MAAPKLVTVNIVLATSTTISSAGETSGYRLLGIVFPSNWTAAATSVSFQISFDGTTFVPVYDNAGTLLSWAGALASRYVFTPNRAAKDFGKASHIKIVASNAQTTDDKAVLLVLEPVVAI